VETETGAAAAVPPEQELTEALLALSWPLPRTVEDADAALTRLEEVKTVLTRLEQQSVGTDAWWAGQVDGLATQSGFVLEWWRPVLRDPDLDWTLNHQAHLTADLATLASAGARLLDQIEPAADAEAAAVHARRAEQEKRWGPTAVPPFPPSGPKPQPPQQVFGAAAPGDRGAREDLNAPEFPPIPPPHPQPAYDAPSAAAPAAIPGQNPPSPPVQKEPESEANSGAARHRRPVYEFDDAGHPPTASPPAASPPAAYPPPAGPAPRSPLVPGPGFGGPPQGRTLAPGNFPAPPAQGHVPSQSRMHSAPAVGAFGFVGEDEDDDEPESLVPGGLALRRHQRRLLIQTGAILGAVGVLCWLAVNALTGSPSHTSAAGDATHTAEKTTPSADGGTAADGLTNQHPTSASTPTPSKTADTSPTPSAAPSTVRSSAPDATTVSSVRVTLLGGSAAVPQIAVLITVDTAGTGQVTVSGSYYGASGSKKVAAESEEWVLSGKTSYQYSVPIANSAYCGTEFHFTVSAGGHSAAGETGPGC
jgi:hypothetical protein